MSLVLMFPEFRKLEGPYETVYQREALYTRKKNAALPASWLEQNPDPLDVCHHCNIPYVAASNFHEDATCPTIYNIIPVRPAVGLNDLILHSEAFVLSFAIENNIPIFKVPSLVTFAQFLAKNRKARQNRTSKLDRTSANYKLKEGLAQYNHESLVTKPLNLDECTASNKEKIFSILFCLFDDDHGERIITHYDSIL